jgi:MFS family permease
VPDSSLIDSPRGWLAVAATFIGSAVTLGTVYSFGSFFESMAADFGTGKGETAVVFGITTFAFFWLSLLTGRMADRFGPRPVLFTGALFLFGGMMITSTVNSLSIGYFTYGAGAGMAAACAYIPMVATVGGWFERQRAAAVGIAVAGIGVGTLVMNPLVTRLLDTYDWRTTFRLIGSVGAVLLLVCTALIARAPGAAGSAHSRFGEAARSPMFRKLWIAALCSGLALFVPFVFVVPYAKDRGVSASAAAWLVGLLGGSSVISRIAFGSLSRRFGTFRLFRMGLVLFPLGYVVWLSAGSSFGMLVLFVLVLGTGYGCFVAVSPLVLADRFGVVGLGSLMGLFYTTQGLGGLIGPPVAGRIIDTTGSYRWPMVIALGFGTASVAILYSIRANPAGGLDPEPDPHLSWGREWRMAQGLAAPSAGAPSGNGAVDHGVAVADVIDPTPRPGGPWFWTVYPDGYIEPHNEAPVPRFAGGPPAATPITGAAWTPDGIVVTTRTDSGAHLAHIPR